jgi:hypothetical protein
MAFVTSHEQRQSPKRSAAKAEARKRGSEVRGAECGQGVIVDKSVPDVVKNGDRFNKTVLCFNFTIFFAISSEVDHKTVYLSKSLLIKLFISLQPQYPRTHKQRFDVDDLRVVLELPS